MNAYAIHDQQNEPIYKSLYPSNGAQPDFHDLESFASLNNALPSLNDIKELSSIWKEALNDQIKSDDNWHNMTSSYQLQKSSPLNMV